MPRIKASALPGTSPCLSAAHGPKGLIGMKMKRDPALRSVQGQAPAKIHSPHLPDEASRPCRPFGPASQRAQAVDPNNGDLASASCPRNGL
jgi:hypothetical protein